MASDLGAGEYLIRRKVFTFLESKFHVYDAAGNLVLFSRQKAFKLREDIRVYTDESMREERLWIKARQIIDFGAAYDVVDPKTQEKLGALRRKGFRSILRDSWEILDRDDRPRGKIEEDSMGMALLRRFLSNLIPQAYQATLDGRTVARFRQRFNPFIFKLVVTFELEGRGVVDPRLILAAGILLVAIEGRQE